MLLIESKNISRNWLFGKQKRQLNILWDRSAKNEFVPLGLLADYFLTKLRFFPEDRSTKTGDTFINLRGRQQLTLSSEGISEEELICIRGNLLPDKEQKRKEEVEEPPIAFTYRLKSKFKTFAGANIIYEIEEICSESLKHWQETDGFNFFHENITIDNLRFGLEAFRPQISIFALGYVPTLSDHLYLEASAQNLTIDSCEQINPQFHKAGYFSQNKYYQELNRILADAGIQSNVL
ncbi:MAG: hypothetical protein IT292_00825 [Deltaproteobacteria bacterium]|nr:hypothetical protein [Deltaproteobacteria bacterium]